MATAMSEFENKPEGQREMLAAALERFRERIVDALIALNATAEDPRWIEGLMRTNPIFNSVTYIEALTDEQIRAEVAQRVEYIADHWSPTLFNGQAEAIGIPEFAYTDIYRAKGLL